MKKIKVAVVIPTHYDIHSSLQNLLKVYAHLIKKKALDVTIFTDEKNKVQYPGFSVEKIKGIDYKTVWEKALFLLGIPRFWYTNLIGKLQGYDVIESSNPEFYGFAYQSYKAARRYNARLVYRTSQTVEGFYLFRLAKYFVVPIVRKAYRFAAALLFSNPEAEERCYKLGLDRDRKKHIVIGHPTDTKCFRPMNVKKTGKAVLLSVGGLYKIKGHHLIIEALKRVRDKGHKDAEVWIVGEGGYKESLQRLAERLGVKEQVKFLGKKSHEELAKIYNQSDIFVLANEQEITPAVNEAMACGKPVVVMDCGGRPFVIPDERYGMVAKRFDIEDMANKILFLMNNRKEAAEMAQKGRKHVLKNFTVEKVAEKIYRAIAK